ncbi:hypothetical protein FNU76_01880 [Chitinimonas arctica]|uniref:Uncharacterized protein n=1 Tax=Chitinimonas arctica TaxID=2594795 RepID=A0A516SAM8_9NEIS|nr:hypothetical protein [Chitinimonas arctica]QDQ25201.1 hypothetical protein FNU76_01880 [Chitinimonas arctica]
MGNLAIDPSAPHVNCKEYPSHKTKQTISGAFFGAWSVFSAGSVASKIVALFGAPTLPDVVEGASLPGVGCAFSLVEVVLATKAFVNILKRLLRICSQKKQHGAGAARFVAQNPAAHAKPSASALPPAIEPATPPSTPKRLEPKPASPSRAPVFALNGIRTFVQREPRPTPPKGLVSPPDTPLEPKPAPLSYAQRQRQAAPSEFDDARAARACNANDYTCYGNAIAEEKRLKKQGLSVFAGLFRDSPLQLASVGARAAVIATEIGKLAGRVVHVAAPVASTVGSIFGIVSSLFHIGQGVIDRRDAKKAEAIATQLRRRVAPCLDRKNSAVPKALHSEKDRQEERATSCASPRYDAAMEQLRTDALPEYRHICRVLGIVLKQLLDNHEKEIVAQKALQTQAEARIGVGAAGLVISTVSLGLTLSGVGAAVGVPVLAGVGGVLSTAWLIRTAIQAWNGSHHIDEHDALVEKQIAALMALLDRPDALAALETALLDEDPDNPNIYFSLALLLLYSRGGKRETTEATSKAELAQRTIADNSSLGGKLSALGLTARRKMAGRILEIAGMPHIENVALKEMLAVKDQDKFGVAMDKTGSYIAGDAGRTAYELPLSDSVPLPIN